MSEEIAQDFQKKERGINFLAKLTPSQIIIFGVLVIVVLAINKSKSIDPRYNYVIYGILVVIILVLWFKPPTDLKLIPEYKIKQIAQYELDRKVRAGIEFPFDSKVHVAGPCVLKRQDDMIQDSTPVGWDVGVIERVHGSSYLKEYIIQVHHFTGAVQGLKFLPFGFSGTESIDKTKVIAVGLIQGNIKTPDFELGRRQ
jgi:hypothetical protein